MSLFSLTIKNVRKAEKTLLVCLTIWSLVLTELEVGSLLELTQPSLPGNFAETFINYLMVNVLGIKKPKYCLVKVAEASTSAIQGNY